MSPLVPVAVFSHNRPDLLKRLIECLRRDAAPLLHVFVDGPSRPEEVSAIAEIRKIVGLIDWCEVVLTERKAHLGVSRSILLGMTELFETHEAAIVFEDHLATAPGTYPYLAAALHHYQHANQVMSVTGWTHPRVTPKELHDLPYLDGRAEYRAWGTWRRAWQGMEMTNPTTLLRKCHEKGVWSRKYGDDLPDMLHAPQDGVNWAGCWLYWHLVHDGLCLRPPHSLVEYELTGTAAEITQVDHAQWRNPQLQACPAIPSAWPDPVEHPDCVKLWRKATKHPAPKPAGPVSRLAAQVAGIFRKPPPEPVSQAPLPRHEVVFTGPHATWEEASSLCGEGYASGQILDQVRSAALLVKDGKAAFERDSIPFDTLEHPWPVLATLYRAAQLKGGPVRVLDFGGSLGSTYFQTRPMLGPQFVAQWCVMEQSLVAATGTKEFEDETLSFAVDGDSGVDLSDIDVLLLSGVVQFLPDPHAWLDRMVSWKPSHILVDRTPVWQDDEAPDTIAIQTVSAVIYPAKYPMRFLGRQGFLQHFAADYRLAAQFDAMDTFQYAGRSIPCQGYLFDLQNSGNRHA